jgi:hypothetical protein
VSLPLKQQAPIQLCELFQRQVLCTHIWAQLTCHQGLLHLQQECSQAVHELLGLWQVLNQRRMARGAQPRLPIA